MYSSCALLLLDASRRVSESVTFLLHPNSHTLETRCSFGLWKVDNATCAQTVYRAIQAGYRLFDGAGDYGNEKEAGEGVRKAIADGLVKREELCEYWWRIPNFETKPDV